MTVNRKKARIYTAERKKALLNLYPGPNVQSKYRKKGKYTKIRYATSVFYTILEISKFLSCRLFVVDVCTCRLSFCRHLPSSTIFLSTFYCRRFIVDVCTCRPSFCRRFTFDIFESRHLYLSTSVLSTFC
jgi:hypothetical protein